MHGTERHIMTGMARDMSPARFNENFVFDARNIRITAMNGNSSLMSVTNEKGTKQFVIRDNVITGTPIGTAVFENTLILFTKGDTDNIYKLEFFNEYVPAFAHCGVLFEGDLSFDIRHPLETLAIYETSDIQKVYWIDGINQPRMINIMNGRQTNPDVFNFIRKINLSHTFDVTKYNSGGQFPRGTIQYCFSYFNKFAGETSIAGTSSLYYLSPKETGLAADGTDVSSFRINLCNLDKNFEYVRLYSIVRTSTGSTPVVKIVGDYGIDDTRSVSVIDTGIHGQTVDPSLLLFLGGQKIVPQAMTTKDNTLFFGNIKNLTKTAGTLSNTIDQLRYMLQEKTSVESATFSQDSSLASGNDFYDYPIDNNRSTRSIKTFKSGENYRLGIIAQDENGNWSEALWLGDFTEEKHPERSEITSAAPAGEGMLAKKFTNCGFTARIPASAVALLKDNGYKKIAPVVVYPSAVDRQVVCQGILAGTVFNPKDRLDNSPYVQADWRFRPGYSWRKITGEIQTASRNDAPEYPGLRYTKGASTQPYIMNGNTFADYWGEQFYRDAQIMTFHSPDVEFTEDLYTADFKDLKMRIVGISAIDYTSLGGFSAVLGPAKTGVAKWMNATQGFGRNSGPVDFSKKIIEDIHFNDLSYGGYEDVAIEETSSGELKPVGLGDNTISPLLIWKTYLWHRNGSLNNQWALTETNKSFGYIRTALLQRKVMSELLYSRTLYFNDKIDVPVGEIALIDTDQNTLEKIKLDGEQKLYYSVIDKVLPPNYTKTLPDGNVTDLIENKTIQSVDKSEGYPIEWLNVSGYDGLPDYVGGDWYSKFITEILNNAKFRGKDPVSMRYKTTKHLVIPLGEKQNVITHLGEQLNNNNGNFFFWRDYDPDVNTDYTNKTNVDMSHVGLGRRTVINGMLADLDAPIYVVDLYREFDKDTMNMRFGGNSQEALALNDWTVCGDTIDIEEGCVLNYTEGDTYIGRYDCLKSYPYTQEDPNSIVSIYSTELESRVNLDERYDKNRGMIDNTLVTPQNFNLFNRPGYEQVPQYFTYHALDYTRYKSLNYPNMLSWSLEKTYGADVDAWLNTGLLSTADLDGDKGKITALETYKDEIFAFQSKGISQILFNTRVQIPASDGQPIEISNGYKYGGKRYITENIGVTNKWSILSTPNGMYFIDDEKNSIFLLSEGLVDLSTKFGFKTWMDGNNSYDTWNPLNYDNIRTFYDKKNGDVYFVSKKEALVYSETLGSFTSFMDYGNVPFLLNISDRFLTMTEDTPNILWELWGGPYNTFFGEYKPYWITFVSNQYPEKDKVFNNVEWRTVSYDEQGNLLPFDTFDTIRVWNDHQDTEDSPLNIEQVRPSTLKKKFNVFRTCVPRDKKTDWPVTRFSRIRNPWSYVKLGKYQMNTNRIEFTDMNVDYFM